MKKYILLALLLVSPLAFGAPLTQNYIIKANPAGGTNRNADSQIIDNGTNVGIGSTTPSEKLDVNGNISGNTLKATSAGDSTISTGNLIISVGSVGVNTVSPSSALHVTSATYPPAKIERTTTGTNNQAGALLIRHVSTGVSTDGFGTAIDFKTQDSDNVENVQAQIQTMRNGADNTASLVFVPWTGGVASEAMRLTNSNVGIGTTVPSAKLDVYSSSYPVAEFVRTTATTNTFVGVTKVQARSSGTSASGFGAGIDFKINDSAGTEGALGTIAIQRTSAINTGDITFLPATAGTPAEKMRLTSGGNLGIGSTNPSATLDVTGAIRSSNGTAGQASCWKADKTLGQCTTVVGAGGGCTCS